MSHAIATMNRQIDQSPPAPSLRVNRSATMTLTTTWADIAYTGTSARNRNLFPTPVATTTNVLDLTKPMVYLDSDKTTLRFQGLVGKTYDLLVNFKVTSSSVLSALALNLATVQLRFYVPALAPITFPLPDLPDGCTDLCTAGLVAAAYPSYALPITASQEVLDTGLRVQVRASSTFLATATVQATDLILYGR